MNKNIITPTNNSRPVPSRQNPGIIYNQRGQVFGALMAGARR